MSHDPAAIKGVVDVDLPITTAEKYSTHEMSGTEPDESQLKSEPEIGSTRSLFKWALVTVATIVVLASVVAGLVVGLSGDGLTVINPRPSAVPFRGIKALSIPDVFDGSSAWCNYQEAGGKATMLKYNATHNEDENILRLDAEPGIQSVSCTSLNLNETRMVLHFNSKADASFRSEVVTTTLVAGGSHWGCKIGNKLSTILLRVKEVNEVTSNQVTFIGIKAGFTEFFKDIHSTFHNSVFPAGHFQETHHNVKGHSNSRRLMGSGKDKSCHGFFDCIWGGIKTLEEDVAEVVRVVGEVAKAAFTGEFDDETTTETGWTFNLPKKYSSADFQKGYNLKALGEISLDGHARCKNCYAHADVGITFELHIENYKLQSLKLFAFGDTVFNLEGETETDLQLQNVYETLVHTVTMDPFTISIAGIPFMFEFSIPIHVGVGWEVEAEGKMQFAGRGQGNLKYGFGFDHDQGWHDINDFDMQHSGGVTQAGVAVNAKAQIYLKASLSLTIDCIGGPVVILKPFIEIDVNAKLNLNKLLVSYSKPDGYEPGPLQGCNRASVHDMHDMALRISLNWGLQIALGYRVGISIWGHHIGPQFSSPAVGIFSVKKPLLSGCTGFNFADEQQHQISQQLYNLGVLSSSSTPSWKQVQAGGISKVTANLDAPHKQIQTYRPALPGTVWHGVSKPGKNIATAKCQASGMAIRKLTLTLQVIHTTGFTKTVAGVLNFGNSETYACVSQKYMSLSVNNNGDVTVVTAPPPPHTTLVYSNCTNASLIENWDVRYEGKAFHTEHTDMATVKLRSVSGTFGNPDGCSIINLERAKPPKSLLYHGQCNRTYGGKLQNWPSLGSGSGTTSGMQDLGSCTDQIPKAWVNGEWTPTMTFQVKHPFYAAAKSHGGRPSSFSIIPALPRFLELGIQTGSIYTINSTSVTYKQALAAVTISQCDLYSLHGHRCPKTYTVTASNAEGSTTYNFTFKVLASSAPSDLKFVCVHPASIVEASESRQGSTPAPAPTPAPTPTPGSSTSNGKLQNQPLTPIGSGSGSHRNGVTYHIYASEYQQFVATHHGGHITSCDSAAFATTGSCVVSGLCITSPNYGNGRHYGNNEACSITFKQSGTLKVNDFATEKIYDKLTIDGTAYSGTTGPVGISVRPSTHAEFISDYSVTNLGWKICMQDTSPSPAFVWIASYCYKITYQDSVQQWWDVSESSCNADSFPVPLSNGYNCGTFEAMVDGKQSFGNGDDCGDQGARKATVSIQTSSSATSVTGSVSENPTCHYDIQLTVPVGSGWVVAPTQGGLQASFNSASQQCELSGNVHAFTPLGKFGIAVVARNSLGSTSTVVWFKNLGCRPGTMASREGCVPCPQGTYQPLAGQDSCNACSAGTVPLSSGGQVIPDGCHECTAGTFENEGVCSTCPQGKYSLDRATSCTSCSPGYYQDLTGATQCKDCAAGTYASSYSSLSCEACDLNHYQPNPQGQACLPCPYGTYSTKQQATSCLVDKCMSWGETCWTCQRKQIELPDGQKSAACGWCPSDGTCRYGASSGAHGAACSAWQWGEAKCDTCNQHGKYECYRAANYNKDTGSGKSCGWCSKFMSPGRSSGLCMTGSSSGSGSPEYCSGSSWSFYCAPCSCSDYTVWPFSGCNVANNCGASCPGQGCCSL